MEAGESLCGHRHVSGRYRHTAARRIVSEVLGSSVDCGQKARLPTMKSFARCVCSALSLVLSLPASAASICPAARPALVAVDGRPFAAVPSDDGCWLFVSLSDRRGHGSLAVLRNVQGSFAVARTVALSDAAFGEALSPDGQMLAVTTRDGVDLLDTSRLEQSAADPLITRLRDSGAGPVYDVISRDDRLLFVSDELAHRISVFNLSMARDPHYRSDALIGHIPMASDPVGLAISPDGKWLYATNEVARRTADFPDRCTTPVRGGRHHPVGLLLKIDVAKAAIEPRNSILIAIPAGCDPVRVAVSPTGQTLWVTARGDDALLRIAASGLGAGNGQIETDSFHVGAEPVGVAIRPDDKQVWVALSARFESDKDAGLAAIDDADGLDGNGTTKLMTVSARGFPREACFMPDGRTLVVTLFRTRAIEFMATP
jgi:DNA-binding beta-propeller fold protein YncE